MARVEAEGSFRKETGRWAIAGGIVAGIIGLITNPQLLALGLGLVGGGWYLRKD